MAGGGQVASASQPPSPPSGQIYGGILNNRMGENPNMGMQMQQMNRLLQGTPQQQFNTTPGYPYLPQQQQTAQNSVQTQPPPMTGSPFNNSINSTTSADMGYRDPTVAAPSPLGILGLQNNLPPTMQGNIGGMGNMGGMAGMAQPGQEFVVRGRPIESASKGSLG